jgi:hypothetical protein
MKPGPFSPPISKWTFAAMALGLGGRRSQSNFLVSPRQLACTRSAERERLVDGIDNHHSDDRLVGVQAPIAD